MNQTPPPDDKHVENYCRPGRGTSTCRYLVMGAGGWGCGKFDTSLRIAIDTRVAEGSMVARGNNCAGKGMP